MSRKFRTTESKTPYEECLLVSYHCLAIRTKKQQNGTLKLIFRKFKGETTKPCKDFRRKDE